MSDHNPPGSGDKASGPVGCGCFTLVIFWYILFIILNKSAPDDPYYSATSCKNGTKPKQVEIIAIGFDPTCVVTTRGEYRFVNRLAGSPVTICMGHGGRCETGHGAPQELQDGVTIQPGEARTLPFPGAGERNYPITVRSEWVTFVRPDLVIRIESSNSGK